MLTNKISYPHYLLEGVWKTPFILFRGMKTPWIFKDLKPCWADCEKRSHKPKWVWWIQRTSSLSKPRRDSNLDRGSPSFTIHNMTFRFRYYDQTRVSMCSSMKLERYLSETMTSLYRTHENIIQSLRFAFRLHSSAHLLLTVVTNPLTIAFL